MKTYKLHFIRHGITSGNKEGIYVGHTDVPLCEEGITEIKKLSQEYQYPFVDTVYTSPLMRCRQTAELIYPDVGMTVVEDLQELNFGEFEGKSYKDAEKDQNFQKWLGGSEGYTPVGSENMADFLKRIVTGIDMIFKDMMDNQISDAALITHGGVIMVLFAAIGFPQQSATHWITPNAHGYTVLLTPQMWMRDGAFEIYATLPMPREEEEETSRL